MVAEQEDTKLQMQQVELEWQSSVLDRILVGTLVETDREAMEAGTEAAEAEEHWVLEHLETVVAQEDLP
jgi:hypothetical protein